MSFPKVDSSRTSALWRYGLFAIDSELLVEKNVKINQESLTVAGQPIALAEIDKIIVVGAGKAGTGMAKGLIKALSKSSHGKSIQGWLNVPDNCVEELPPLTLHPGRPAGLNEPTEQGLRGSQAMLDMVQSAGPGDAVICLVSGGGSALAPLPIEGVSLDAKKSVTQFLSKHGATINELNAVRTAISQIKGGGLVDRFSGHSFHTLIISDVLGNPLDVIASGMTVPVQANDLNSRIENAKEVLNRFDPDRSLVDACIYQGIEKRDSESIGNIDSKVVEINNHVIGDNQTIVSAIEQMARQLGYDVFAHSAKKSEGDVELLAENLWNAIQQQLEQKPLTRPFCFISGGEPTVNVGGGNGKGGRNQHLALLMLDKIAEHGMPAGCQFEFVSIGSDGEDGPTDAAGAVVNQQVLENLETTDLDPKLFLTNRDSYSFFEAIGGLIKTGPTHTNVCDIRIFLMWDEQSGPEQTF